LSYNALSNRTNAYHSADRADQEILELYEEAVAVGGDRSYNSDSEPITTASTRCGIRYPRCPIQPNEVMEFIRNIHMLDDIA
jgi:hypothetical protein